MKPPQPGRPHAQIERERPAAQDDLRLGQKAVALRPRARRRRTLAQVAVDGPLGPGLADLLVEPTPGVDDAEPRVETCNLRQLCVTDGLDDENVDRARSPPGHGGWATTQGVRSRASTTRVYGIFARSLSSRTFCSVGASNRQMHRASPGTNVLRM